MLPKNRRWFNRGAAAFEATFPGLLTSKFGEPVVPLYVCPICDRAFDADHVGGTGDDILTLEHVPPDSFGGQHLVLTCKRCNNTSGSTFDAHARNFEIVREAKKGRLTDPLLVRVTQQSMSVNATLGPSPRGSRLTLGVSPNGKSVVKTSTLVAFTKQFDQTAPAEISFIDRFFREETAKLSWLRSGFLALFSVYGYRLSCDPAFRGVKDALTDPDEASLTYLIELDGDAPWSEKNILFIPDPKALGVRFGRYVVIFPPPGDMGFYDRVASSIARRGTKQGPVTAPSFTWFDEPSFGFDQESGEPLRFPPDVWSSQ